MGFDLVGDVKYSRVYVKCRESLIWFQSLPLAQEPQLILIRLLVLWQLHRLVLLVWIPELLERDPDTYSSFRHELRPVSQLARCEARSKSMDEREEVKI